jgi:hypothetical protein
MGEDAAGVSLFHPATAVFMAPNEFLPAAFCSIILLLFADLILALMPVSVSRTVRHKILSYETVPRYVEEKRERVLRRFGFYSAPRAIYLPLTNLFITHQHGERDQ